MTYFWCKFGFGRCFGVSSQFSHWAGHCERWYTIHFSSHVTILLRNSSLLLHGIREDDTSKFFFDLWSALETLTYQAFLPFQLALNVSNGHTVADVEFFGNFSCSFKWIIFDDCSQSTVVKFWWPATALLIFKALVSFAKLLEAPCTEHSLAVPGPYALLMLQVVSTALQPILNVNKIITQICILSNIISIV